MHNTSYICIPSRNTVLLDYSKEVSQKIRNKWTPSQTLVFSPTYLIVEEELRLIRNSERKPKHVLDIYNTQNIKFDFLIILT